MATRATDAAAPLLDDLREIFGDRLVSLVLYGRCLEDDGTPLTSFALVRDLTLADLEGCARAARRWSAADIGTPLVLPERELQRSLDTFPLEYREIMGAHARVFGPDPFEGAAIATEDLRRACEVESRGHLLHLREGFIESGGRPAAVADLMAASVPGFTALLRNVARLAGHDGSHGDALVRDGARAAGLDDAVVDRVLTLARPGGLAAVDPARLFPDYLAAVEQLARMVDRWHA